MRTCILLLPLLTLPVSVIPEDGQRALQELQGQAMNNRPLRIRYAQQRTIQPAAPTPAATAAAREERTLQQLANRSNRLILRNLHFQTQEADIRAVASKHGTVEEVSIPTSADGKRRGFAFVKMASHKQAAKALEAFNTTKLKGREVAADFSVPKDRYVQAAALEAAEPEEAEEAEEEQEAGEEVEEEAEEGEEEAEAEEEEAEEEEADEDEEDEDYDGEEDDEEDDEEEDDEDDDTKPKEKRPEGMLNDHAICCLTMK